MPTKAEVRQPALKKRIVSVTTTTTSTTKGYNIKDSHAVPVKTSYGKKRNGGRQSYSRRSVKHRKSHGDASKLVEGWQEVLQKQYVSNPYPTSEDYDRLANETGMERRLVPRWFINMRKGGMSKTYSDSGARTSTNSPRRSKANHSILKVEGDLEKEFKKYPYPTPLQYQQLATRLKVEKKLVRRWFISRRRTKAQLEQKQLESSQKQQEQQNVNNNSSTSANSNNNKYNSHVPSKLSKSSSPSVSATLTTTSKNLPQNSPSSINSNNKDNNGQSSGSNSTTSSPSSIGSNELSQTLSKNVINRNTNSSNKLESDSKSKYQQKLTNHDVNVNDNNRPILAAANCIPPTAKNDTIILAENAKQMPK